MQRVNFFDKRYETEHLRTDALCGLVDPEGAVPAYSTTEQPEGWIGIVENPDTKAFRFTPIDNNIELRKDDGNQERACDGMLVYEGRDKRPNIAFVELKDKQKSKNDAVEQLETTLRIFLANHDAGLFHRRFAYYCNRQHPYFNYSTKETGERFRTKYKFRYFPQQTINLNQGE